MTMTARRRPVRWLVMVLLILVGVLALLRFVVAPLLFWRKAEGCERPKFTLVRTFTGKMHDGGSLAVQVRHYSPYLVAEVYLPRGLSEQQGRTLGFRQVAGYIFGGNVKRKAGLLGQWAPRWSAIGHEPEKISMTAPVQCETDSMPGQPEETIAETIKVTFTMPSKYKSLSDLPVPNNRNVTLRAVSEHYAAVAGFRGPPPKASKVVEVQAVIETVLREAGLQPQSGHGVMVYQYHDPFATPNLLRWNEVAILLDPAGIQRHVHGQTIA